MGLNKGARKKYRGTAQAGKRGLRALRYEIDSRIVDMVLNTLTEHQRELLAATSGNPGIEAKLENMMRKLLQAEAVLGIDTMSKLVKEKLHEKV